MRKMKAIAVYKDRLKEYQRLFDLWAHKESTMMDCLETSIQLQPDYVDSQKGVVQSTGPFYWQEHFTE